MLRYLEGTVFEKKQDTIGLMVGGFGFLIQCSKKVMETTILGEQKGLYTYLHVSENGFSLFGFQDEEELEVFQMLMKVKGVGAKSAMSFMRFLNLEEITRAIAFSEIALLTTVPGVGKKTAERICFELKQKMLKHGDSKPDLALDAHISNSVTEAMITLGFSPGEAVRAIRGALEKKGGFSSEEELLQAALQEVQVRKTYSD
ncbi:Holliday junction DNA helicase subunit RuvA [Thermovirga lienii DSM 17291]|jgi:Holliday junction DNA helicase RuvA|uniref:Holliday junction branch migration complex subunit RuvA n=1 Tax=Thermovirga lienii (strain ATCC BAA-1197 / DSM 17291 / Cas60314) TaxID=580340 RepID=G7VA65_THELD|nr:Holliday junction branch migration protein RuvA [Thermovirga lienii]AER66765.1 Holliday junction DNA helicase subunit RuvA [Thermovirga lienii DSM 17291]MDN5318284.1 holliday junction helicase RuvA [Thermovirga sp.]MDN5367426.1 holliday junction helicase RuvA [Thermovirga sp.]